MSELFVVVVTFREYFAELCLHKVHYCGNSFSTMKNLPGSTKTLHELSAMLFGFNSLTNLNRFKVFFLFIKIMGLCLIFYKIDFLFMYIYFGLCISDFYDFCQRVVNDIENNNNTTCCFEHMSKLVKDSGILGIYT